MPQAMLHYRRAVPQLARRDYRSISQAPAVAKPSQSPVGSRLEQVLGGVSSKRFSDLIVTTHTAARTGQPPQPGSRAPRQELAHAFVQEHRVGESSGRVGECVHMFSNTFSNPCRWLHPGKNKVCVAFSWPTPDCCKSMKMIKVLQGYFISRSWCFA
jgi:hypothetical protein